MDIADCLDQWKTIRGRRNSIEQFLSENRIVEVEWRTPEDSSLQHEGSTPREPSAWPSSSPSAASAATGSSTCCCIAEPCRRCSS